MTDTPSNARAHSTGRPRHSLRRHAARHWPAYLTTLNSAAVILLGALHHGTDTAPVSGRQPRPAPAIVARPTQPLAGHTTSPAGVANSCVAGAWVYNPRLHRFELHPTISLPLPAAGAP